MHWWEYILIGISVVCTFCSIYGAFESKKYYKKSKQLTIYANTNIAYIESQKIISTLTEMLKLANKSRRERGTNPLKKVSEDAEIIKNSLNRIRESLSVADCKKLQEKLDSAGINIEHYINSIITGSIFSEDVIVWNDDFTIFQQTFYDIQFFIKESLDAIGEKLK